MPKPTCQRLTFVIAKCHLAAIDWTINRMSATGEYRIYPNGSPNLDYFTDSLLDAYQTAKFEHSRNVAADAIIAALDTAVL